MRPSDILTHDLLESWNLRGGANGYQAQALRAILASRRGVAVLPAGSGKTIVGARTIEAIARGAQRRFRVLWIANTIDQLAQGERAIGILPAQYRATFDIEFRHPSAGIEGIGAVDILVVDECHHAAAEQWRAVIAACGSAHYIIGFTATDHREDGLWPEVERMIGPVLIRVSRETVESDGYTVSAVAQFRTPNAQDEMTEIVAAVVEEKGLAESLFQKFRWKVARRMITPKKLMAECQSRATQQVVMDLCIANNEVRNRDAAFACNLLLERGHSVLALVYSVEQGRFIQSLVPGSGLVFSRMKVREDGRRENLIEDFRNGVSRCLIATSLADEGLDVPRASALVYICGGRGISRLATTFGEKRTTTRLEQRTARVLRAFDGKKHGVIIDFFDHQHPFSRAQSMSRLQGYKRLGFAIQGSAINTINTQEVML